MRSRRILLPFVALLLAAPTIAWAADDVVVPDVTGQPVAEALARMQAAGLTARVVEIAGPAAGVVDAQDPVGGTRVPADGEIALLVGTAVKVPTTVPDVRGRLLDEVIEELESVYFLEVGFVDGPEARAGRIVAQSPAPATQLLYRGVLSLEVVRGPEEEGPAGVLVPSLIGQKVGAARRVLGGLGLEASVARVADPAAAPGTVLSQDPPSGAEILRGGTVFLRVARAPGGEEEPGPARVPLAIGLPMAEAEAAVLGAGLVPRPRYRTTADFPAWTCIHQDPSPGEEAPAGSQVTLTIARPVPAPEEVVVPTVIGSSAAGAEQILVAAGLVPVIERVPSSLPLGRAFEQEPAAGRRVAAGTHVHVSVARRGGPGWTPQTVQIPELVRLPVADALHLLLAAGLQGRVHERAAPHRPVDVVEDQEPGPGATVAAGSIVHLYVPEPTVVPDLLGHSRTSAIRLLQAAGLNADPTGPTRGVGRTRVTSQDPSPEEPIARGSTVRFFYGFSRGSGPVYGTVRVPDVTGLSRAAARAALEGLGLRCACHGPSRGRGHTRVVSQSPVGGSLVRRGSAIRVEYVFSRTPAPAPGPVPGPVPGPAMVRVPRVTGMSVGSAQAALARSGLTARTVGAVIGPGRPYVHAQAPRAGSLIRRGTVVQLTVRRR